MQRRDTVLFGALNFKEESEHAKAVDLVFRHAHLWSLRKPEKAAETCSDDVDLIINQNPAVKGVGMLQATAFQFHDCLDDFHITIDEVILQETVQNGVIVAKLKASGNWVKPVGKVEAPKSNPSVVIPIAAFLYVKNGKIFKIHNMTSPTQIPEWENAWVQFFANV